MLTFTIFSALHWLSVAVYAGSLFFLLVIFQRTYGRYKAYRYVDNFRAEIIYLYWRFLNIAFVVILASGAALAGLKGRSVLAGTYGLIFSLKLVLWLVQIYVTQSFLKPFNPEVHSPEPRVELRSREIHPIIILVLLLLIALCGFFLKYL